MIVDSAEQRKITAGKRVLLSYCTGITCKVLRLSHLNNRSRVNRPTPQRGAASLGISPNPDEIQHKLLFSFFSSTTTTTKNNNNTTTSREPIHWSFGGFDYIPSRKSTDSPPGAGATSVPAPSSEVVSSSSSSNTLPMSSHPQTISVSSLWKKFSPHCTTSCTKSSRCFSNFSTFPHASEICFLRLGSSCNKVVPVFRRFGNFPSSPNLSASFLFRVHSANFFSLTAIKFVA